MIPCFYVSRRPIQVVLASGLQKGMRHTRWDKPGLKSRFNLLTYLLFLITYLL